MTAVPMEVPNLNGRGARHTPGSQRCLRQLLELCLGDLGEHDIYRLGEVLGDHLGDIRKERLAIVYLGKMHWR